MDRSITAILIKSEERKESDYLVRLFSTEGMVTAIMRGVRRSASKMKFAAQPFAFCVYELAGRDIPVVTGAARLEDFSPLTRDIMVFSACSVMLEAADFACPAVDSGESFVSLLKCLKTVMYDGTDARVAAIKYLLKTLHESGFFRHEKSLGITGSEKTVTGEIAGRYLDELKQYKPENDAVTAALLKVVRTFEKNFDCRVNSAEYFLNHVD